MAMMTGPCQRSSLCWTHPWWVHPFIFDWYTYCNYILCRTQWSITSARVILTWHQHMMHRLTWSWGLWNWLFKITRPASFSNNRRQLRPLRRRRSTRGSLWRRMFRAAWPYWQVEGDGWVTPHLSGRVWPSGCFTTHHYLATNSGKCEKYRTHNMVCIGVTGKTSTSVSDCTTCAPTTLVWETIFHFILFYWTSHQATGVYQVNWTPPMLNMPSPVNVPGSVMLKNPPPGPVPSNLTRIMPRNPMSPERGRRSQMMRTPRFMSWGCGRSWLSCRESRMPSTGPGRCWQTSPCRVGVSNEW